MQKVNVQPKYFGSELFILINSRFTSTPVILGLPVLADITHVGERDALTPIVNGLVFR